jgi:AcrR family transcriptional regulator
LGPWRREARRQVAAERALLGEAMARVCARRGYAEAGAAEVEQEAGLGAGAFAEHFAEKEEGAIAAVEAILGRALGTLPVAYSADSSERESVVEALRLILEVFAADPAMADLAMINSRQMMPRRAQELHRSGFVLLEAMLDRLRADQDEAIEVPGAASRAAIGGGEALVRRELIAGRGAQLAELLPELVYTATVPFLGQEEALRLARSGRGTTEAPRGSGGEDG